MRLLLTSSYVGRDLLLRLNGTVHIHLLCSTVTYVRANRTVIVFVAVSVAVLHSIPRWGLGQHMRKRQNQKIIFYLK